VIPEAYWGQAYSAANPDGGFDRFIGPLIYEELMQVFTAVQMAGPNLTPGSVERGFASFRRNAADDGSSPTAYYTPADHTFVKDLMLVRWDVAGTPPGGSDPSVGGGAAGCYRELDGGARHLEDGWPSGDHGGDQGGCGVDWLRYSGWAPDQK
jgi:hypothetical protein